MSSGLDDTLAVLVREQVIAALDETLPKYFSRTRLPPRPASPVVLQEYFKVKDVAKIYSVCTKTVRRWISRGLRPCPGRPLRIARSEIERFMSQARETPDDVNQVVERRVERLLSKKK